MLFDLFTLNKKSDLPGAAGMLWGDEEFFVIPDIAPIIPGHLLLLTTRHHLSMGAVPEHSHDVLERHAERIDHIMRAGFGRPALFVEHGATRPHEAGSCIDHAHWHCLPDTGTIIDDLESMGMQGSLGQLRRAKELHDSHQPYFLARNYETHLFFPADSLPCQFIRLVTATGGRVMNPRWQSMLTSGDNHARFSKTIGRALIQLDELLRDNPACQSVSSSPKEIIDE